MSLAAPSVRTEPALRASLRMVRGSRDRRRQHARFLILCSWLVGLIVLGVVSTNALLAQASFTIGGLEHRIDGQSQQYLQLTHEQATLSAPGRIAAWARRHDMRPPDVINILHVPGAGRAAPVGEPDVPNREALALKAVVEGSR